MSADSPLRAADGRLRMTIRLAVGSVLIVLASVLVALSGVSLLGSLVGEVGRGGQVVTVGVGATLGILFVAREVDHRTWSDLGLAADRRWGVDLAAGLALGALLMTGVFVVLVGGGWARITQVGVPDLTDWLGTLGLFLVVGFYEELFARGWLLTNVAEGFRTLGDRLATAIAVFVSAAVFGALHGANPGATLASTLGITAAGVFLGVAYVRTTSLALPVGVHVTWNLFQGAVWGFPVSGIATPATFVATARSGPELVTGGSFGPEASLVGLGASVAGVFAVVAYARSLSIRLPDALAWATTPTLLDDWLDGRARSDGDDER
ncbi:CPBP family intramembrane glutamic endopeptidase [Halomarina salina]|uniref:CPBP family intramembrane glutamic endopeptidase n=1 Tax=Halomarina salina TaxID=1872699 RepID=A0ABD5RM64_9EURY|nr:CPBP family intramembrane glutamic endopeptidase [Halomarina salina]